MLQNAKRARRFGDRRAAQFDLWERAVGLSGVVGALTIDYQPAPGFRCGVGRTEDGRPVLIEMSPEGYGTVGFGSFVTVGGSEWILAAGEHEGARSVTINANGHRTKALVLDGLWSGALQRSHWSGELKVEIQGDDGSCCCFDAFSIE